MYHIEVRHLQENVGLQENARKNLR